MACEIVGDRDDWKQNEDQHGQGDYLGSAAGADQARVAQPVREDSHC